MSLITAERKSRIMQIGAMMQRGNPTIVELAEFFGVSEEVIKKDVEQLYVKWNSKQPKRVYKQRSHRTKQLEYVYERALDSYEKSQDGGIEEIARKKAYDCPRCAGDGVLDDSQCIRCLGTGEIWKTSIEYKKRELPGDAAHLNTALKAVKDITTLNGLAAPARRKIQTDTHVSGGIVNAHVSADGKNPYENADPAAIHAAMAAIHQLKGNAIPAPAIEEQPIEGKVVKTNYAEWKIRPKHNSHLRKREDVEETGSTD